MDYVAAVLGKSVRVVCSSASMRQALAAHGVVVGAGACELAYSSKQELARTLQCLQQVGLPFVDEPAGWPPAAVFQQYRNEGLVSGSIKTVSWRGPNEPIYGEV